MSHGQLNGREHVMPLLKFYMRPGVPHQDLMKGLDSDRLQQDQLYKHPKPNNLCSTPRPAVLPHTQGCSLGELTVFYM